MNVDTQERDTPSQLSSAYSHYWPLDPSVIFLNHGSYGACPRPVLKVQQKYRDLMERDPMHFFKRDYEPLLDDARRELATFVGAEKERLAFVSNTTTGINAVLRSLRLEAGDELLTTNHTYNACRNALAYVASRSRAKIVTAQIPFPVEGPGQIIEHVLQRVTKQTRLALLDHVSSPTGLIFPIEELVKELHHRGIDVLVDGAHAPGMLPLNLQSLGAAFYVGNCHKWLCAPKGAAFLYVDRKRLAGIHPLGVSHGASSIRTDRSRFHLEFDWTGTDDPSPFLSIPEAIRFGETLFPGGWQGLGERNHQLALQARQVLCQCLGVALPCPDDMIGSLASIPFPDLNGSLPSPNVTLDPVQETLFKRYRIEVPISPWPAHPQRLLRLSAHLYNDLKQYSFLARVLRELLSE